jgi:adenylosuccinate synthase
MKCAIITVGLGFGDEGKGATVDFLARTHGADLVVRYCGGSQAGHNVQLPDGRRHTFSQFGAATLVDGVRRPRTYLGPNVVIDPTALTREARHLSELGVKDPTALLTVNPRCLVTTAWHRALNRVRELARGADRHGSCGQGIGEARRYWLDHGCDAVLAEDLRDPLVLRDKLELLRQRTLLRMQEIVSGVDEVALRELDLWERNAEVEASELEESFRNGVGFSEMVPECRMAIFEGAQGVLLDEYRGFHPHTTWSTVTTHHVWELIAGMDVEAVSVLGITRAYTTRHGAGPLPTHSAELTARFVDPGNPPNSWQGSLRSGWLDLPLLRYAASSTGPLDGIVVNHLDQINTGEWFVCEAYRNASLTLAEAPNLAWQSQLTQRLGLAAPVYSPGTREAILRRLGEIAPVVLTGSGPTHQDRSCREVPFRRRTVRVLSPE